MIRNIISLSFLLIGKKNVIFSTFTQIHPDR